MVTVAHECMNTVRFCTIHRASLTPLARQVTAGMKGMYQYNPTTDVVRLLMNIQCSYIRAYYKDAGESYYKDGGEAVIGQDLSGWGIYCMIYCYGSGARSVPLHS